MKLLTLPVLLFSLLAPAAATAETQEERDARFAAMIEGAELIGEFNIVAPDGTVSQPQTDEYAVSKLERGEGDNVQRFVCFTELEPGDTSGTAQGRRAYRLEGNVGCTPEGQSGGDEEEEEEGGGRRGRRSRRGGND